jgi:phage virion morphogenesis protein
MSQIEINTAGIKSLLKQLSDKVKHPKLVLSELGEIMLDDILENFEQEGRPKWQDLKPATWEARRKKGHTGKILNIHGASGLVGSINYKATKDQVSVGTNKVYASALHYGVPARNLVARPFLTISDLARYDIMETLRKYIEKAK